MDAVGIEDFCRSSETVCDAGTAPNGITTEEIASMLTLLKHKLGD